MVFRVELVTEVGKRVNQDILCENDYLVKFLYMSWFVEQLNFNKDSVVCARTVISAQSPSPYAGKPFGNGDNSDGGALSKTDSLLTTLVSNSR